MDCEWGVLLFAHPGSFPFTSRSQLAHPSFLPGHLLWVVKTRGHRGAPCNSCPPLLTKKSASGAHVPNLRPTGPPGLRFL